MCGIFGYLNYLVPQSRKHIVDTLLNGLRRLEYRGYDSAGIAFDGGNELPLCSSQKMSIELCRQKGKVAELQKLVDNMENTNWDLEFETHAGIAHTRWATHGEPSPINSHPQRSDKNNEFVVVHNGIINNYKDLKAFLEKKGFVFESETDTEVVVKLCKYLYDKHRAAGDKLSFQDLVELTCAQLEGAFSFLFKSIHFPGELACTRRGSPLLIGVKCDSQLATNHIPVLFSKGRLCHTMIYMIKNYFLIIFQGFSNLILLDSLDVLQEKFFLVLFSRQLSVVYTIILLFDNFKGF